MPDKLELLGKGSYGQVHLVIKDDKRYARKSIDMQNITDDSILFEVDFACRLKHPNIIHAYFIDITNQYINLYFDVGKEFTKVINDIYVSPISNYNSVLKILHDTALGLNYMHTLPIPCYHSDIKQPNIIVYGDLKNPIAKLIDFSLAGTIRQQGDFGGTLGYSSPETYTGFHKDYLKSDVWSYGVLMLFSLSGLYLVEFENSLEQDEYAKQIIELVKNEDIFNKHLYTLVLQSRHIIELYFHKSILQEELDAEICKEVTTLAFNYNNNYNKSNDNIIETAGAIITEQLKVKIRPYKSILITKQKLIVHYVYQILKKIFVLDPKQRISMQLVINDPIWEHIKKSNNINSDINLINNTNDTNNTEQKDLGHDSYGKFIQQLIKKITNNISLVVCDIKSSAQELLLAITYFYKTYPKTNNKYLPINFMLVCFFCAHVVLSRTQSQLTRYEFCDIFNLGEDIFQQIMNEIILGTRGIILDCTLLTITNNTEESITQLLKKILNSKHAYYKLIKQKPIHFDWTPVCLENILYKLSRNKIKQEMTYIKPCHIFGDTEITMKSRSILCNWLFEVVAKQKKYDHKKLSDAITYVDWITYNHGKHVTKKTYQLIGLLCSIYAYASTDFKTVKSISEITANTYTSKQVCGTYTWIGEKLPFRSHAQFSLVDMALHEKLFTEDDKNQNIKFKLIILFQSINENADLENLKIVLSDPKKYVNEVVINSELSFFSEILKTLQKYYNSNDIESTPVHPKKI